MIDKLTAALVKRLTEIQVPEQDRSYPDDVVSGLFLRIKPPAAPGKRWASYYFIRYTDGAGSRKKSKVAPARLVTLDEARAKAKHLLARVTLGADPVQDKQAKREAWTVKDAVTAYLLSDSFLAKTPETQAGDKQKLDFHIVPYLGGSPVASVDAPAALRLVSRVKKSVAVNSRGKRIGGPGAATKTARILSALLTFVIQEGRMKGPNPVIGKVMKLEGDGKRSTVITQRDEYGLLMQTMDEMVAEGVLSERHRAFFTVVAATGMRRGEVQKLRWRDVDLREQRLAIHQSKGDKLAKRRSAGPEIASLPPIATAQLAALAGDHVDPDALVFPPAQRGVKMSVNREWVKITTRAGFPRDLVIHSLRHSIGTVAAMGGMSAHRVQKMLRHSNPATSARYIHLAESVVSRLQHEATASIFDAPAIEGVAEPASD